MDETDECQLYPSELPRDGLTHLRQTIPGRLIGGRPGDCFRTVIACLLGSPRASNVPHFVEQAEQHEAATGQEAGSEHWRLARLWLREVGLDLGVTNLDAAANSGIPYILGVRSHRGPWGHCVIAREREVIWDPSGLDDYSWDEHDDENARMLVLPYSPDPDEEVARWAAEPAEASEVAS